MYGRGVRTRAFLRYLVRPPRTTTAIWFTKTSVDTQHPLITLIVASDCHDYPKAAVAMLKLNCGDG